MNIVYAGVISGAPTISEIVLNALLSLLGFAGGLAVLGIIISGLLYMTSSGDTGRSEISKKALVATVTGLVFILLSLTIIKAISKAVV